jgi:GntR family transcriptional regulator of vanillate catabolism
MAVRLAAERGLDATAAAVLHETVAEMDGILTHGFAALEARARWIELNGVFHRELIGASGNPTIAETVAQLSRRPLVASVAIVFDQTDPDRSKGQIKLSHDDHHAILDAILNRQGERAASRMREHALASGRNKRANIDAMKRGTIMPRIPGVELVMSL